MNFDFGEVLTRAWQIVWKHRVLWIFGILASCGRGGGGGNGGGARGGVSTGPELPPQVTQWLEWIQQNAVTFVVVVCVVVLLIWLIMLAIGAVGKIGLIRGTAQADGGVQRLIFGQLFSEGMPYFGRMLGLSVILILPAFLLGLVVAVLVVLAFASSAGDPNAPLLGLASIAPVAFCCACLFIPLMFVLNMIFRQAERAAVLEDLPVMPALARGWEIFRANLGPILLMAIILGILGLVAGLIVALPVFIIVIPAAIAYGLGNAQNTTPLVLAALCFCLYLPILLLLNGILVSYVESAWTLTYMRLTRGPDTGEKLPPEVDIPPTSDVEDNNKTVISRSNA